MSWRPIRCAIRRAFHTVAVAATAVVAGFAITLAEAGSFELYWLSEGERSGWVWLAGLTGGGAILALISSAGLSLARGLGRAFFLLQGIFGVGLAVLPAVPIAAGNSHPILATGIIVAGLAAAVTGATAGGDRVAGVAATVAVATSVMLGVAVGQAAHRRGIAPWDILLIVNHPLPPDIRGCVLAEYLAVASLIAASVLSWPGNVRLVLRPKEGGPGHSDRRFAEDNGGPAFSRRW